VAATVSLSASISDLAEVGAEVVPLVFRCAFHVDRVARTLDVFDPESLWKNWIYVILNESEQNVRHQLEAAKLGNVSLLYPFVQPNAIGI
jgi:Starter unit:ACP transacylase in aflatoxin biosynthesis